MSIGIPAHKFIDFDFYGLRFTPVLRLPSPTML